MSLREYRRKRNFSRTDEPSGSPGAGGKRPIFVVQLHHARRRHFDFRLQVGKVLKSWAVPKGPSFDPAVKRLAVEVEDHPLSYADFEGDIPEGNYGAGHVDQFDRGLWASDGDVSAQLRKGHLEFTLYGKRLHGRWHLVRSHRKERQPAWFLIKSQDEYAGDVEADDLLDTAMPASRRSAAGKVASRAATAKKAATKKAVKMTGKTATKAAAGRKSVSLKGIKKRHAETIDAGFFPPALTQLRHALPEGDDWLHEIKWDGYRILTAVADGDVRCWSRNALEWTDRIADIADAVRALGLKSLRLDGELVVMDGGRSDFAALQKTLSGERRGHLVYMVFDVLHVNGQDVSQAPLIERKALLKKIIGLPKRGRNSVLGYSDHVVGHGEDMLAMVMKEGLEGVVSKRTLSAYHAGRSGDWLKIKRLESDEFAVVGYTPGKGSREGFGSLLLGRPGSKGGWDYAGRVGSGFSDAQLKQLGHALAGLKGGSRPTVHENTIDPLLRQARWIRPQAVVEVYYRGMGGNGLLRQPSLKALREDKTVASLHQPDRPARGTAASRKSAPGSALKDAPVIRGITITHPEREVYPGITKLDVARYYDTVMDWFLPGVQGRPLSILRCPDGTEGTCFFQKHPMPGMKHVKQVSIKESSGAKGVYLCPTDETSIIELVQFGVIEFHPWGGLAATPDKADRVVFDLDPADDVSWERVVSAARTTRRLLSQLGLESFVRTTGGKGLHVVVPLRPSAAWAEVEVFAKAFAMSLAGAYPDEFVAVASKAKRRGKIFFDYLRNGRGATSVASYSLRARPGAPVAVPLRWEELGKLESGAAFDLARTVARLKRLRGDPWKAMNELRQSLARALKSVASQ
ncbi:DNA ligase D [Dyella sp. C11]|uniref:DNA ligase D n=1 Tax=Dyella sp. C11 TaxID=2126991 RepID=UPI000D6533D5|nr:DNA ligase D [Dyella sp. C11]